jgi:hypothetical protein
MRCIAIVGFPAPPAFYDDAWLQRLTTVYGAVPQSRFFDLHPVVDCDPGTARIDAVAP